MSLEHLGSTYNSKKAIVLGATLDEATSKFLLNDRSPSRKVNELDNRGSHFYLAMYWAEALAIQKDDKDLSELFKPFARALAENESKIVSELNDCQGVAVNVGGYYHADPALVSKAMRPSKTLNQLVEIQSLAD